MRSCKDRITSCLRGETGIVIFRNRSFRAYGSVNHSSLTALAKGMDSGRVRRTFTPIHARVLLSEQLVDWSQARAAARTGKVKLHDPSLH